MLIAGAAPLAYLADGRVTAKPPDEGCRKIIIKRWKTKGVLLFCGSAIARPGTSERVQDADNVMS